jgi:hypothetical protein
VGEDTVSPTPTKFSTKLGAVKVFLTIIDETFLIKQALYTQIRMLKVQVAPSRRLINPTLNVVRLAWHTDIEEEEDERTELNHPLELDLNIIKFNNSHLHLVGVCRLQQDQSRSLAYSRVWQRKSQIKLWEEREKRDSAADDDDAK